MQSCIETQTHQNGEAGQKVVNEDDTTDQVGDLQWSLQRLRSINGRPALPLGILHHDGGHVKLVLIGFVASLDGEGLEKSDADADDAHGHAAADQQEEANAETQADLGHDEAAVGGVEAVDGVVPAHSWQRGQDEGDHPDAHHRVHCLLLRITQPGEETTGIFSTRLTQPAVMLSSVASWCSMGFNTDSWVEKAI